MMQQRQKRAVFSRPLFHQAPTATVSFRCTARFEHKNKQRCLLPVCGRRYDPGKKSLAKDT